MQLADPLLARRLEGAEADAAAETAETALRLDPACGAEVLAAAGGQAAFVAPGLPVNRAVGMGMGGPVPAADLESVEAFYRRHAEVSRIDLRPLADRTLVDGLGERGYAIARVLNIYVRTVVPDEPVSAGHGIDVAAIGPGNTEEWALTLAQGFLGRDVVPEDDPALRLARLTVQRPSVTGFLARIGGVSAGAAALAVADGLAVLFSTSTRDAHRNRGVQRALLSARIAAAAAAGCDLATVAVPPGSTSERNVRAAGFRHAYARMIMVREWG